MTVLLWVIIWLLLSAVTVLWYSHLRLIDRVEFLSRSYAIPQEDYGMAMCGGCGRSVPLKSDRFSLADHQCDFPLQGV